MTTNLIDFILVAITLWSNGLGKYLSTFNFIHYMLMYMSCEQTTFSLVHEDTKAKETEITNKACCYECL